MKWLLSILMLCSLAYAQDIQLVFNGRVINETGGKMDGVKIQVKGGSGTYYSKKGKFATDPQTPGKVFTLVFSKPGYITKEALVDSKKGFFPDDWVPETNFEFEITMLKADPDMDYSNFPQPAAKAKIDPATGLLDFDHGYIASCGVKMDQFMTKQEEFLKLYRGAKSDKNKEEYAEGLNKMEKARLLFTDQPKANALYDELKEMSKGEDKQYTAIITKADEYFDQENWDKSEKLYTRATGLKPTDPYPKKRLKLIDEKRKILEVQIPDEDPVEETPTVERTTAVAQEVPTISRTSSVGQDLMNQKEKWIREQANMNSRERTHQEYVPKNYSRERTVTENNPNKVNPKERVRVEYVPPSYNQRERSATGKNSDLTKKVERQANDLSKMREMMETASKKQESRSGGNQD